MARPSRTQPKWISPRPLCLVPSRADEPGSGRVSGARTIELPRWLLASLASAAAPTTTASISQRPISQPYRPILSARSGVGPAVCSAAMKERDAEPRWDISVLAISVMAMPFTYGRYAVIRSPHHSGAWEKLLSGGHGDLASVLSSVFACLGIRPRLERERLRVSRRPARPSVPGGARDRLHRPGGGGQLPVPLDARRRRAGPRRRAAGQSGVLLRMRPRARNRRPLSCLQLYAGWSGSGRCGGAGSAADDVLGSALAAAAVAHAIARRRGGGA